jgi:hypothetical protein
MGGLWVIGGDPNNLSSIVGTFHPSKAKGGKVEKPTSVRFSTPFSGPSKDAMPGSTRSATFESNGSSFWGETSQMRRASPAESVDGVVSGFSLISGSLTTVTPVRLFPFSGAVRKIWRSYGILENRLIECQPDDRLSRAGPGLKPHVTDLGSDGCEISSHGLFQGGAILGLNPGIYHNGIAGGGFQGGSFIQLAGQCLTVEPAPLTSE